MMKSHRTYLGRCREVLEQWKIQKKNWNQANQNEWCKWTWHTIKEMTSKKCTWP